MNYWYEKKWCHSFLRSYEESGMSFKTCNVLVLVMAMELILLKATLLNFSTNIF